jgi:hypothetical protein
MIMRFSELTVGARFEFRGRRYEKMNAEIGRDEERGGNVFHPATEVGVETFRKAPNSKAQHPMNFQTSKTNVQGTRTLNAQPVGVLEDPNSKAQHPMNFQTLKTNVQGTRTLNLQLPTSNVELSGRVAPPARPWIGKPTTKPRPGPRFHYRTERDQRRVDRLFEPRPVSAETVRTEVQQN